MNGDKNIHPLTKKILNQEGILNMELHSKKIEPGLLEMTDFVVTVCNIDSCVILNNIDSKTTVIKWNIKEPLNSEEEFCKTLKKIQKKCKDFLSTLNI